MGWQAFVTDALTEIGCSQIADQIIELATQPDGLGRLADVATLRLLRVPESKYADLSAILTKLRVSRLRDAFGGDWADEVEQRWPGPIAHELHRFRELLERSHVVDAVWQFKDFAEIFLKLPALVMLSDLLAMPQCPASTKERLCSAFLGRRLSLGGWIATVRDVVVPLANETLAIPTASSFFLPRLFGLFDKKSAPGKETLDALSDVVTWRNRFYGHGAFSLEADFLLDQLTSPALKLAEVVRNAARLSPWEDAALEALTPGGFVDLTGWQTIRHHHERGVPHTKPDLEMLPIKLRRGFRVLDLSPYVALRRCPHCRKQDPFVFDSRDGRHVNLLDYVAGHPLKSDEAQIAGMTAVTAGLNAITPTDSSTKPVIDSGDFRYRTLANARVEQELDRKALESRYRSPQYLRDTVHAFIETHDRGVFWLAGPSMIGKTVFVHGLAGTGRAPPLDEPLTDELGVVAFHIREGQQARPRHMVGRLDSALTALLEVAESRRPPLEVEAREQPSKAFVEWLAEFFQLPTHKYRKLLVCLDGLDELPERSEHELGILDCLPTHEDLPAGIYILLTSRPRSECRVQLWNEVVHTLDVASPNLTISLEPTDSSTGGYYDLLRGYVDHELDRDLTKAAARHDREDTFRTIIEKAESRFSYVSYLVERLVDGTLSIGDLKALPSGDRLIADFELFLRTHLGHKRFEHAKRLIVILAAAEDAHDWEVRHPGYPAALLNPIWNGLPVDVLADLLGDLGDELGGPSISLLALIFTLKSVLLSWRGEGSARAQYRLGLKEMSALIRVHWRADLTEAHWSIAESTVRVIAADSVPSLRDHAISHRLRYLLPHTDLARGPTTAPLSLNTAIWSESVLPNLSELIGLNDDHQDAAFRAVIASEAIAIGDLFTNGGAPAEAWRAVFRFYITRTHAFQELGRYSAAGTDLTSAIDLMERLGRAMGNSWPMDWESDLASAYGDRASLHVSEDRTTEALSDLDKSTLIKERLRRRAGNKWPLLYRYNLATGYMNRGEARRQGLHLANTDRNQKLRAADDIAAVIADYDRAIELASLPIPTGDRMIFPMRRLLAQALDNKAVAETNRGDLKAALARHSQALQSMEELRSEWGDAWPPDATISLTLMYMNRARSYSDIQDWAKAFIDLDKAILLQEDLRTHLGTGWTAIYQNSLASAYRARADVRSESGDDQGAVSDFKRVIDLMEELRLALGDEIPQSWLTELARVYAQTALHAWKADDRKGPDHYSHRGVELMEHMYHSAGDKWSIRDRAGLAMMRMLRGRQYDSVDSGIAALADFDRGISIMEAVIDEIPAWWRHHLGATYRYRARLRQQHAGSIDVDADLARAEELEKQAAAFESVDLPAESSPLPLA